MEMRARCAAALAALLLVGCGASTPLTTPEPASPQAQVSESPSTPMPLPSPSASLPTVPPATPHATPVPTEPPTPAPSFVPPTVATFAPGGTSSASWDLVALGDSNVSGWGIRSDKPFSPQEAFPGVYAGLLGAEQGVTVVLHSYYPPQVGATLRTVAEWADVVGADPSMRADLERARVVILLIGYHDVLPALAFNRCPSDWPGLRACLQKLTAPMPAAFDRLYGEVAGLVPKETTVLVVDYSIPGPIYDRWGSEPYWPEFKRVAFEDWRDALEAAALKHGFRVIHTYAAVNDASGKPKWNWSDVTSDGWHFNAEGHRRIAEIVLAQDGLGG